MTITKAVRQRLQSVRINQGFTRVEAFIGDLHTGVVKVDDANNSRIYVTIQKTGQVIQAKNNKCPNRLRFPVWIGIPENSRVPHVLESRDLYPQTAFPEVPEHDHTIFESDNPTWVRREQVLDGLPMPIGGMEIRIHNYPAYVDGKFVTVHKVFDMSTYVPTSGARWVNVEVDVDGDISYVPGDSFASRDFLAPSAIPVTPANRKLLFSLKTYAGQTGVTYTRIDSDIFDPRFSGMSSGGGGGTPAGGDREIQFNDDGDFGASSNLKLTTDGSLVLGTPSPHITIPPLSFAQGRSGGNSIHYQFTFGDETLYSRLVGYHAKGTLEASAATELGYILNALVGRGFWNVDSPNPNGAELRIVATENHADGAHGTAFEFWVIPNGSDTRTKIATIDEDGINLEPGKQYLIGGKSVENGWQEVAETWTRTGNHTFTVPGDLTTRYRKGKFVRYKGGGSYEYGIIKSSSYSSGTTTIQLIPNSDFAMADVAITDNAIATRFDPDDFPHWFSYPATFGGTGVSIGNGTIYARFTLLNPRTIYPKIRIVGGSETAWGTSAFFNFGLPVDAAVVANGTAYESAAGNILDVSASTRYGLSAFVRTSDMRGIYGNAILMQGTPITLATGDEINLSCPYEW